MQKPSGQIIVLANLSDLTERYKLINSLSWERRQYRDALFANSKCHFSFDVTSGIIETPFEIEGFGSVDKILDLKFPCSFDDIVKKATATLDMQFLPKEVEQFIFRDQLLEEFKKGRKVIKFEVYFKKTQHYYDLSILLSEDDFGHVAAIVIFYDITDSYKKEQAKNAEFARINRSYDEQLQIMHSFSGIYFATWFIDFKKQKVTELFVPDWLHSVVKDTKGDLKKVVDYLQKFVAEKNEGFREFLDLSTLMQRIGDAKVVSYEYKGTISGWCSANIIVVERDKNGIPISAVFAVQNIQKKKQKELEAELAMKQAFESANKANTAKTDFLSRMSHDIRTPMNAIIGMTAIASEYIDNKEKLKDCFDKINNSSRHLLALINEVLDMSRIESGRVELGEEEFNLVHLIHELVDMVRPQADEKHHTLNVNITRISHEIVFADSLRLQQVFMNIASNAVKYTPNGGQIEISVRERKTKTPFVACYEFTFTDNGIGMPNEFLQKICTPFERVVSPETANIQGTGLGMAIAKNIVTMMNGDIKIESSLGHGTKITVTIYLKIKENDSDAENNATEQKNISNSVQKPVALVHNGSENSLRDIKKHDYSGKTILVAEDNEINRDIITEILGMMNINVETAENGRRAVEKFAASSEGHYNLIFMDLQMPDMNGFDATSAIRHIVRPDAKRIPIIAMSANAFADDIIASRNAGMNEHLAKPIEIKKLEKILDEWL